MSSRSPGAAPERATPARSCSGVSAEAQPGAGPSLQASQSFPNGRREEGHGPECSAQRQVPSHTGPASCSRVLASVTMPEATSPHSWAR